MPVLTNVIEIITQGHCVDSNGQNKNIYNVWHYYQSPTVSSPPSAVAVANAFIAGPWNPVVAGLSVGYVGDATLARYLDDVTNPSLSANNPGNGATAGARLPSSMAIVMVFRTATRGKSFRGSKHLAPIAESSVTGDELSGGAPAFWQGLIPALIAPIAVAGQTFAPCIVSRTLSQLRQNPTTIIGSPLTQGLLNKTIGTMRRRKERTAR